MRTKKLREERRPTKFLKLKFLNVGTDLADPKKPES